MTDDPSLDPNQFLFDETMIRQSELMRVESYIARKALGEWAEAEGNLVDVARSSLRKVVSRGGGALELKAIQYLAKRQGSIIDNAVRSIRKLVSTDLDDLASREVKWSIETHSQALPNFDFKKIRPANVKKIARTRPMNGLLPKEEWSNLSRRAKQGVMRDLRQGIIEGSSYEGIAERIRDGKGSTMKLTGRQLDTYVRTNVAHISNEVNKEVEHTVAKEAGLKEERFYSTMDKTTCQVCAAYDGEVFKIGKGPYPVLHPNCHCKRLIIIPGAEQKTRSVSGGNVPASTHYHDFLRNQPKSIQARVLGPKRAQLFREGKLGDLEPKYLVDANNRPLPLRDLLTKLEREGKL